MKEKITLLLLFIINYGNYFSQENYNPEFLIPFNDHGKWGWCDTSGQIKIKSNFSSCGFFYKENEFWKTTVSLGDLKYQYILNKGYLPIDGAIFQYSQSKELLSKDCWIIGTKSGRLGVYQLSKSKLLIDTLYRFLNIDKNAPNFIVLQNEKNVYSVYDILRNKVIKSKVVDSYYRSENNKYYYKLDPKSEDWFIINEKGVFEKSFDKFETFYHLYKETSNSNKIFEIRNIEQFNVSRINPQKINLPDGMIFYSSLYLGNQKSFVVFKKDQFFGVIDYTNNEIIIPNIYDFIDIDYQYKIFILHKNKKTGAKIINTIYNTIEPKYESIIAYKKIRVNPSWSFLLFEINFKNQKGFVGENGIEYFNLD